MRRQKGSLLQRIMAIFLSTALVVGMTANAMPMHVLAQENVEGQDKAGDGTNDPKDNPDDDLGGNPGDNPEDNPGDNPANNPDANPDGNPTDNPDDNPPQLPAEILPGGLTDTPLENEEEPPVEEDIPEAKGTASFVFQVYGYDADAFGALTLTSEDGIVSYTTEIEDEGDYTEITLHCRVDEFLTQEEDSRWSTYVSVYRDQTKIADYTVYKGEEETFAPRLFYAVTFINEGEKYFVDYVLDGQAEDIKPSDPVREGYEFTGWMTTEEGGEAFDFTQEIAGSTTVYAGWTAQTAAMSMRRVRAAAEVNIDNSAEGRIILNGTPVVVAAADADAGKTLLYYDENRNGVVDAGENPIELEAEIGTLDEGYDLSNASIYGGASDGDCSEDIKITMTGGTVALIQAGFTGTLHGNYDVHMMGGTVGQIRSAGYDAMTGNVNIVIGGNAVVREAVYGAAQNPGITIDGNINITIEGNASIGPGGEQGCVFIGGQQPNNVITGASVLTITGGNIRGSVYADQFATDFRQKITMDIQGGTISGAVQGVIKNGSQAPGVEIRVTGGTIQSSVIGAQFVYVEDIRIVVDGGTIGGQIIGAWADQAGRVSIDIGSGSVGPLVVAKANKSGSGEGSWTKGTISIHGGMMNGMVVLRHKEGVAASTEASEILLAGAPVFGTDGKIVLRPGEAVTQTGEVTSSSIPIDVSNVNQEGTLVVRPADGGITLNPEVFALSNTDYILVPGSTSDTSGNLYLGTTGTTHSHQWEEIWANDDTHHWHNCEAADCPITNNADKNGYAEHTEDDGTVTTAPTQDAEGIRTYKCSVCGRVTRTEQIDKLPSGHTHNYGTVWTSDAANHWHECRDCGDKKDIASHTEDGGTVTTAPTQDATGTRTYKCSVCGRVMRTETIPATGTGGDTPGGNPGGSSSSGNDHSGGGDNLSAGDNIIEDNADSGSGSLAGGGAVSGGTISSGNGNAKDVYNPATAETRVRSEDQGTLRKEVHIKAEDTFDTIIATPLAELADMLLTDAEKQLTAGGLDTRLVLDVKDAAESVSSADKDIVEAAMRKSLPNFTLGQYLDISLYKLVGTERTDIARTSDKIIVTIAVPERLRNTDDSKTRVFAVIRVHDGKADILNDLDTGEDTISIATDLFSTYAIVYQDVARAGAPAVVATVAGKAQSTRDNEPRTQDNRPIELYATLAMISGLTYLLLYFTDRRHGMSEETKKELVARLIGWAKCGGRMRRWIALAAIFALLVYYHSIGKQTTVEWKEVYGE